MGMGDRVGWFFLVGWLVGFVGEVTSLSGLQFNRSPGTFMHRIMRHVGLAHDTTAMTVSECYTREGANMPSWFITLTCSH